MSAEKQSPCKVNLLLNILSRRADGFHDLETVIYPVAVHDLLNFQRTAQGIHLTCNHPDLPTGPQNLVYRAAAMFLAKANIKEGVRIHMEKRIPLSAGLGGGSGNAATTLVGLNELFGNPLSPEQINAISAELGSDVPFFLQSKPALATGRGEQILPLDWFPAFRGAWLFLIHPGFGIPTAWAYQQLSRFPSAVAGNAGRAQKFIASLEKGSLKTAGAALYNLLEAPALEKYPLLVLFQQFLRENGAAGALMSGSGSSTFALIENQTTAENLREKFKVKFGETNWTTLLPA